jgi:exodeoxyribonuclease VII small subunit
MAEPKPKRRRSAVDRESQWLAEVEQLSFNEARTALELAMAKLQSSELEVEEMATLYRRAEAYANRCSAVLQGVEQDVIEWDSPTT